MMDMIWKRIEKKRPKGKKLIKIIGIVSGLIWVVSLGAVFALKDKKMPKALLDAAGAKNDTLKLHGVAQDHGDGHGGHGSPADEHGGSHGSLTGEHGADANSHGEPPSESQDAHGGMVTNEGGEEHAGTKATLTVDLPSREEWEALKQLVELNVSSKAFDKALIPLKRVMVVPTRDPDLLTLATTVFLGTGNYQEALQTAEQALALRPNDFGLKAQYIEATYRLGQVENALVQAQAEVKAHPAEMVLLLQLATMEIELGPGFADYGKTLAAALKLNPEDNSARYLSGRKSQLEGNYSDAVATFKEIMRSEPKRPRLHAQMGMALYHLGRLDEAEWEYEIELALNASDYNTWFNLGELHLANSSQDSGPETIQALRTKAMECFLKAVELNPLHAQAHYRIGVLLNGNGQFKEAIRHLDKAHKLDGRHVPTLIQLALAYENLRQPERAKQVLTKAYELDPLNKVVLFKLKPWS
jgi:tetratricopeptide (TPR) repeat protein